MAKRVLKIEGLMLNDHSYLDDQDECYFAGEYTARKGFAHSETNQLILNFKKSVDKRNTNQWQYKESAILKAADIFKEFLVKDADVTLVPIPPSKAKTDPLYDDRLLCFLKAMCSEWQNPDIRELVLQKETSQAAHSSSQRPTPDSLISNYYIDQQIIDPLPKTILVFDDVLTTGCHFKAIKNLLTKQYGCRVIGLFIARRVPESDDFAIIEFT